MPRISAFAARCNWAAAGVAAAMRACLCWPHALRRCAGALLCAALLMPMLTPLSALAEAKPRVTCCCKGVCHCRSCLQHRRGIPADGKPAFDLPGRDCPCNPVHPRALSPTPYALIPARLVCADVVAHPAGVAQTAARLRFTSIRIRQKRGPPALFRTA